MVGIRVAIWNARRKWIQTPPNRQTPDLPAPKQQGKRIKIFSRFPRALYRYTFLYHIGNGAVFSVGILGDILWARPVVYQYKTPPGRGSKYGGCSSGGKMFILSLRRI